MVITALDKLASILGLASFGLLATEADLDEVLLLFDLFDLGWDSEPTVWNSKNSNFVLR